MLTMTEPAGHCRLEIATDENGLAGCGCGANDLYWSPPRDWHAREADHSFEEAKDIGGPFGWELKDPESEAMKRMFSADAEGVEGPIPDSWDEYVERERGKAERNGVQAICAECYGSMSPTVVTDELADRAETGR